MKIFENVWHVQEYLEFESRREPFASIDLAFYLACTACAPGRVHPSICKKLSLNVLQLTTATSRRTITIEQLTIQG